ncbi:hypothetical protein FRC17_008562 [Serendipita sp. 399]|nr:hypothetical protein FRC17_008562 [Serendipita sp. 399]
MKFSISVFTLLLASIVAASPVPGDSSGALEKRALYSTCATWGTYSSGSFTVYQNLWGQGSATSGSQCLNVNSVSGSTFAWDTTWSWAGGPYNVKSYDNVAYNIPTGIQVSKITSIPTTWNWSQSGSSPINNVAYDLMTNASSNPSATHQYEVRQCPRAQGESLNNNPG